jgi:hypothetical protein
MEGFSLASQPGAWVVDMLPWCAYQIAFEVETFDMTPSQYVLFLNGSLESNFIGLRVGGELCWTPW